MESLVIVKKTVTVNAKSNLAHTAHHARKVLFFRSLRYDSNAPALYIIKYYNTLYSDFDEEEYGNLGEVETR